MTRLRTHAVLLHAIALTLASSGFLLASEEWPAYSHDNARSDITPERLRLPLREAWRYQAAHPPVPAWPAPAEHDYWHDIRKLRSLVTYDRAYQVVVAGGKLFFGTSSDNKVYALDAKTGEQRWSFFAGGPIRLAPTVADGRVYVGSDDGSVYSIDARGGRLLWKFTAEEKQAYLPGNGRMISRWPIRAGLVVDSGTVYFGAGL
ncbi:MAG: PQQ-binding-like beta-propeller repeat protein, partial [Planctomycetota bacterium]|nr:PQQ-binding-like beta-propeller repeat protein [Planctomycetota bacterium]